ncbi:hypothetical protein Bbelb_042620 [Branchiostoma belcheri]|nr:hypothetical protein Bbelb_042620 [Branchiostoma belcheri]
MAIWRVSLFLKGAKKQSACHLAFSSLDLCGPGNTGYTWRTMLGRLQQSVSYSGVKGKGRKTKGWEVWSICSDPAARAEERHGRVCIQDTAVTRRPQKSDYDWWNKERRGLDQTGREPAPCKLVGTT